jgi:hypothetical protein
MTPQQIFHTLQMNRLTAVNFFTCIPHRYNLPLVKYETRIAPRSFGEKPVKDAKQIGADAMRDSYIPTPWEFTSKPPLSWNDALDEFDQKILAVRKELEEAND